MKLEKGKINLMHHSKKKIENGIVNPKPDQVAFHHKTAMLQIDLLPATDDLFKTAYAYPSCKFVIIIKQMPSIRSINCTKTCCKFHLLCRKRRSSCLFREAKLQPVLWHPRGVSNNLESSTRQKSLGPAAKRVWYIFQLFTQLNYIKKFFLQVQSSKKISQSSFLGSFDR